MVSIIPINFKRLCIKRCCSYCSLRKTAINLIASSAGIDLASEFANHSGTDVTKKHYVKKTSAKERKSKLLEIRKKAGF